MDRNCSASLNAITFKGLCLLSLVFFFFLPIRPGLCLWGSEAADIDFGTEMSMKAEGECFGSLWKIKRHSKQRVVIEPVAHLARGLNRKSPVFADPLINDWQTARTHSQRLHCAPRQKEARTSRSLSPSRNKSLGSSKAHWRRQKLEEILLCHSS